MHNIFVFFMCGCATFSPGCAGARRDTDLAVPARAAAVPQAEPLIQVMNKAGFTDFALMLRVAELDIDNEKVGAVGTLLVPTNQARPRAWCAWEEFVCWDGILK